MVGISWLAANRLASKKNSAPWSKEGRKEGRRKEG
jgi:hypothetical protein